VSFPAPDPLSGAGGQASRFLSTVAAAFRGLVRRDDDPLELIARERAAFGERYWPEAKPALKGEDFLDSITEMTVEELRWRIRVHRVRDVLGLIALAAIAALVVACAWRAVSPL
jgi:hypothetical protein